MRHHSIFALGGLVAALMATPASAGCYTAACYQKVVTPPVYGTVAETVQVRPASVARHVSPAQYGTVAEAVVVRPAQTVARHVPPVVRQVPETVQVSSGGRVWQVSRDAYGREVGCWVDVPPKYATRLRTEVVQSGGIVHETIPAVTAVRHRTVMTRPAQVHEHVIPAQYATRHHTVQVAPATASWQRLY
ncbi:MAG TPA: hypothetical protein PLQ11_04275 [Beijerinckiaceae bacterium]|nr:hypothetical protein [Beijerinckiaceae bacterium]